MPPTKNPSIFNALIIYGILPIAIFVAYSFIDEKTFGLLNTYRVPNAPLLNPKPQPAPAPIPNAASENTSKKLESDQTKFSDEHDTTKPSTLVMDQHAKPTQQRAGIDDQIDFLRQEYIADSDDLYKAIRFADAMLNRSLTVHDGGLFIAESIRTFLSTIDLIKRKRNETIRQGRDVRETPDGTILSIDEEMSIQIEMRSIEGLLVGTYCSLGKQCKLHILCMCTCACVLVCVCVYVYVLIPVVFAANRD